MLKEQDNATPGSAGGGSIKSEPPLVKEEPSNGEIPNHGTPHSHHGTPLNGLDSKEQCKSTQISIVCFNIQ